MKTIESYCLLHVHRHYSSMNCSLFHTHLFDEKSLNGITVLLTHQLVTLNALLYSSLPYTIDSATDCTAKS